MAEEEEFAFEEEEGLEEVEAEEEEQGEEEGLEEAEEVEAHKVISKVPKYQLAKYRITRPVMTKNELAKILTVRVKQLEKNAPTTLTEEELGTIDDIIQIALLELTLKKSPMMLERPLPNGTYEIWDVNELELPPQ